MVSPISSPNMSDISDTEVESESMGVMRPVAASKVKRSESDVIVMTADRPKHEKPPVRRCESTDDATKDRLLPSIDEIPPGPVHEEVSPVNFPQNIKTVASKVNLASFQIYRIDFGKCVF